MPTVVDLTADSDDEDLSSSLPRSRPSAPGNSSTSKRPNVKTVKSSPTKQRPSDSTKTRPGATGANGLPSTPKSSQSSGSKQRQPNGEHSKAREPQTNGTSHSSQQQTPGSSFSGSLGRSQEAAAASSPRKEAKQFQIPRSLPENLSQKSCNEKRPPGGSTNGLATSSQKRPRESDDSSNNDRISKKTKTAGATNGGLTSDRTTKFDRERRPYGPGLAEGEYRATQKTNAPARPSREIIDLLSPQPEDRSAYQSLVKDFEMRKGPEKERASRDQGAGTNGVARSSSAAKDESGNGTSRRDNPTERVDRSSSQHNGPANNTKRKDTTARESADDGSPLRKPQSNEKTSQPGRAKTPPAHVNGELLERPLSQKQRPKTPPAHLNGAVADSRSSARTQSQRSKRHEAGQTTTSEAKEGADDGTATPDRRREHPSAEGDTQANDASRKPNVRRELNQRQNGQIAGDKQKARNAFDESRMEETSKKTSLSATAGNSTACSGYSGKRLKQRTNARENGQAPNSGFAVKEKLVGLRSNGVHADSDQSVSSKEDAVERSPERRSADRSSESPLRRQLSQDLSDPISPITPRRVSMRDRNGGKSGNEKQHAKHSFLNQTRTNANAGAGQERGSDDPAEQSSSPRRNPSDAADEADLQLRTEAMEVDQDDTSAKPMAPPAAPVLADLPPGRQVERILGKHLEEMRTDNEYWTSISLQRALQSYEDPQNSEFAEPSAKPVERDWFADLKPVDYVSEKVTAAKVQSEAQFLMDGAPAKEKGKQTTLAWVVPYDSFSSSTPDVPSYAHYVSLRNNILAPNVANLHAWPYFGDDFEMAEAINLKDQYNLDIKFREEKLLLWSQAENFTPYIDSALREIECSWADVLRYLIEERPHKLSKADVRKRTQKETEEQRRQKQIDSFSPTSSRSILILSTLPPSTPEKLTKVDDFCESFEKMAKFDLWHIARRSNEAKLPDRTASTPPENDHDLTCRLCLRFDCAFHGELNEQPESESESDTAIDSAVATDIVNPPKLNYRTRVEFSSLPLERSEPVDFRSNMRKKDYNYWRQATFHKGAHEQGPFYPCDHEGMSCEVAECSCFTESRPCEKMCGCAPDCSRRFQGCSCARTSQQCFNDLTCPCFQVGRECDPDLCGACGVCEVVDPVNRYNEDILTDRCRNCSIQRGVPKSTLLGDSGIHGLGLYACDDIQKDDFVGEYKGEIITKEEAERRGAVYELQKLSYLFSLNAAQEVDSTYFGNKVRFINHAAEKTANLYPRIITVNTVHRIALYASRDIDAGQELLFDYGPKFPNDQLGGSKEKKSAPHMRNTKLFEETFVDVDYKRENGKVRAKAADRSALSGGRGKQKKPRGGARPGAGRKPRSQQRPGEDSSSEMVDFEQDAGSRLAAFNISDDRPTDEMEVDADAGADDEEYRDEEDDEHDEEEEEEEEEYNSEASEEVERSDGSESDEDDGHELRTSVRRVGVSTRFGRR